jgi:hypothetical protein
MHQSIRKVEITLPENPDPFREARVLKLEVQTNDPLGVLEMLERFLSGKPIILPGTDAPPPGRKDPLIDATRPAGTPRSEEQRALEDEAEAIGGVVTHAAGGVPVVVPAGEEPIGIPVEPATPGVTGAVTYVGVDQGVAGAQPDTEGKAIVEAVRERLFTPPAAAEPTGVPEVQKGDKVAFQTHDGITYVLHDGKPLPADLQRLVAGAEGRLVVQKVSKRKDCVIALVEGGWAVKLIADAAGLPAVLEVKPPAVASQPPPRVDAPAAAPSSPPPAAPATATAKAAPAAVVTDPALAGEVAKAMAMLPKLQAADGVRGVMEELLAAGCPHEQMYGVCNAIRESVACLKKQANLKDRVPRLLQIIGQG